MGCWTPEPPRGDVENSIRPQLVEPWTGIKKWILLQDAIRKYKYLDPPRGAKWMGKGANKQYLRVLNTTQWVLVAKPSKSTNHEIHQPRHPKGSANMSVLRILRLFRLVRIARVGRHGNATECNGVTMGSLERVLVNGLVGWLVGVAVIFLISSSVDFLIVVGWLDLFSSFPDNEEVDSHIDAFDGFPSGAMRFPQ